jgi:hypothetical protein
MGCTRVFYVPVDPQLCTRFADTYNVVCCQCSEIRYRLFVDWLDQEATERNRWIDALEEREKRRNKSLLLTIRVSVSIEIFFPSIDIASEFVDIGVEVNKVSLRPTCQRGYRVTAILTSELGGIFYSIDQHSSMNVELELIVKCISKAPEIPKLLVQISTDAEGAMTV